MNDDAQNDEAVGSAVRTEKPVVRGADPTTKRRCVTCGASRREGPICYRCKSDLTPLLALEHRANALRAEARRCYALGWFRRAAALLSETLRIEAFPEDFKLLACAGLRCGDFQTVCRAYARFLNR